MAKLGALTRQKLPAGAFAGPDRSFPLTDRSHDRAAISGATRSERAGNITTTEADKIKAKARRKLGDRKPQMVSLGRALSGKG